VICACARQEGEAISCLRNRERYREQESPSKPSRLQEDRPARSAHPQSGKARYLYSVQGLVVDARAQYLVLADTYSRAGDSKKAVEVLHKIADLDPNNTDVRSNC